MDLSYTSFVDHKVESRISLETSLLSEDGNVVVIPECPQTKRVYCKSMNSAENTRIRFNWSIFWKELFYHITFPFGMFICCAIDGKIYTKNHKYWFFQLNHAGAFIVYNVLAVFLVFVINILYFWFQDSQITLIEIIMANLCLFVNRMSAACAYAYMDPQTMQDLFVREISDEEFTSQELTSGWIAPNSSLCDEELSSAAKRVGFCLTDLKFFINAENYKKHDSALMLQLSPVHRSHYCLCMQSLLRKLIREVSPHNFGKFIPFICFCFGLLNSLIPSLIRYSMGIPIFGSDWKGKIVISCCLNVTAYFYGYMLQFLYVGILDHLRRARLLTALSVLIDPSDSIAVYHDSLLHERIPTNLPWVDLSIPENSISWSVARQVIQAFGHRFTCRIYANTTFIIAMLVFLIIFLVGGSTRKFSNVSLANHTTFYMVFYNLIMILSVLGIMVYFGSKANDVYWCHRGVLTRIQMAIRENTLDLNSEWKDYRHQVKGVADDKEKLKTADLLIESVIRHLEVEDHINPVTILGFRASTMMFSSIFTAVGSLITLITQFYY